MGKSSKKRKGRVAQLADSSSAESSRQATPATSDSEGSSTDVTPPSKKQKTEKNGPVKRGPKSSQDICDQHGLVDVDLQYTEADYMNLTNYGLFVRMVRPQVQAANPSITSSKMAALMEAKWREFREGNPFSKTKKAEDILVARNLLDKSVEKKKDSPREEKKKAKETPPPKPKAPVIEWGDDDEDDDDDDDDDKDEDEDEEEEEEEEQPRRRSGGSRSKVPSLKIRLPGIKMPTPSSSRKTTPKSSAKKSRSKQNSEADSDVDDRSRRSRGRTQRASSKRKYKEVSEEDLTNDDEDDTPRRRRASKKKKRQTSDEEEFEEDEDDYQKKKKKQSPSQPETESDQGTMSDSESIESEEDGDRRPKKKKRPETKAKPVIPGERKSERSRKGHTANMSEMTDREFEKMLKEKDKEKAEKKKKREKKRKQKSTVRDIRKLSRKGYWQKEKEKRDGEKEEGEKENGKDGDDDDNHNWFCEVCEDGGELLLCDKCPRSFHKECAKLEVVPEGDWECPKCTGDMSESEDSDTGHEHYCRVCRDGGDVLLCDYCPSVYHMTCLNPAMKDCPDGEWKCPRCIVQEKPLKGWVQNVLTWRWSNQDQDYDELDHTHSPTKKRTEQMKKELAAQKDEDGKDEEKSPERLLFVKYRDYSYWECDWISELQLEVFHSTTWTFFKRKYDQEEPPALEDGSSFGARRHHTDKADDPNKLEERFYKWGIKPSWLQIHRIINHDTKGKNKIYLVKWQDLGYEFATWEDARDAPDGLEDFDKHIDAYWKRRNERLKAEKEKGEKERPKKSLLKKKAEAQPTYFDETGGKLHPYQLEGLNWLRFSYSQDTNTILADEMGLGKTIQAISFLYVLWKEGFTKGPFMVSAPLSTVPNWEREFQFWAPEMYVISYSGGKDARQIIREHEFSYREGAFSSAVPGRFSRSHAPKFDVILTSYEMVSMDKTTFASIEWDVIIIDEAHRLRSNQSLFFKTLCDYKVNYKLLLTGTPLQNNLEELFHLLNFLEPGKFDDIDNFLDNFSEISKDDQVRKLHEMLAPHMLRRMKADVLKDIPSKSEFIVRVELAPMQKKYYKHILTKNYEALNVKGYGKQTSLINIMMDLRKCCNHPYLFPSAEKDAPLSKNGQYEINALIKSCGKLDLLSKMLKVLKQEGHRVLIFSQMTRVLDILEDFMYGLGYGYERIDGSIMGKLRQAAIDRFNSHDSDSFVFLLSTKAGGLGINLATADTVIIFDMDWNPHNDIQAFSRAHRIGQKNKVMIYRFVSRHTVEEKMTQVCKKKMMLTELVIQKNMGAERTDSLSKQEVNDILRFGAEELFKDDDDTKELVYDDEAVHKLLDRSQESEIVEDQEKEFGLNEYLRSFKVASYQVKEGDVVEEVPEEEEEDEDLRKPEEDREYWKRVLGDAYEEHRMQMMQEQENLAASLGKGKRARRQINYAERVMIETPEKKEKRVVRTVLEDEEEEEEEDREDLKFFSDYEPDSSADSESSGEEEGTKSKEPSPPPQEPVQKKKGRMKFADKIEREREEKLASKELPPLLSKVNGEIEVLGFTARQRRAFHDAIMRYGMPHEDVYRSQWLVRDLRTVPEKAFKAYVSLFMRHLGEPIRENNTEIYSDGVPREGLSRQHVLARIGMMALIRKKVSEFEKHNGCHSMKINSMFKLVREIVDAKMKKLTEKEEEPKKDKEVKEEKDSKKNGKEGSEKNNEKVKEENEKADDKEEKKESKSKSEKEEKKESKSESEKECKEEKEETKDDKECITNGNSEKKESEEKKDNEKSEKEDDEDKEKKSEEKKECEKEGEKEVKDEEKKEKEETKNGKEEKMEVDEQKENKDEKESKADEEKPKENSKSDESKEKKEKEEKKKSDGKTKEEKQMEMLKRQVEERQEKARQLRRVFYIADGGLTDLKNLWNYEEGLLKEENEMLIWHRQHDYWLLTGTITHGYRHWQDILNDPRFELLNKAFNNDADKMRKGAFLNRRFQLLEQALTIEEQLRRELNDNNKLQQLLPPIKDKKSVDNYTDIDRLADLLRSLIKDGRIPAGTDERLIKLLVQIENLVGDIRQASYSGMPATLARAPVSQPRVQSTQRTIVSTPQRSTPVRQILEQRKQSPTPGKGGNVILID